MNHLACSPTVCAGHFFCPRQGKTVNEKIRAEGFYSQLQSVTEKKSHLFHDGMHL
jgi:hypothetical protein